VVLPADHDQQLPMPAAAQTPMALTPQQAASRALAAVGPTTTVSVQSNVVVAGEAAYQLVLAPKSPSSLVGQVRIAIDAAHNVPLRVQVFAKHAASPAFQVGFQSISFVRPAAANFDFTPPPGAKVTTEAVGREGWPTASGHTHPQVIGTGWLSVAVLPSSGLAGLGGGAGSASRAASSAAQSASGTTPSGASPGEETAAIGALLHSATPVHGAWGSGRLLRTSLMSLLITSNGQVLVGAVTPSVLYADAAHVG